MSLDDFFLSRGQRFNLLNELIRAKRFGDVIGRASPESFFLAFGIILGADDDDGNIRKPGVIVQEFAKFETGKTRHHQIQCDQVWLDRTRHFDGFCAVVDCRWLVTLHADQHFHKVCNDNIVVYDKNLGHDCILQVELGSGKRGRQNPLTKMVFIGRLLLEVQLTRSRRALILDFSSSIWKGLVR